MTGTIGQIAVNAGTYSVTETLQTGWDIDSATCNDGSSSREGYVVSNINIPLGGNVTCTFLNIARGSITVHKLVVAPNGQTPVQDSHSFTVRLNGDISRTINEGTTGVFDNLMAGLEGIIYTITEDTDSNYDFVSFSRDDNPTPEAPGAQILVTAHQNIELTIKNAQKQGQLTIIKHVINHDGIGTADANDFSFIINDGQPTAFLADEGILDGQNIIPINPGTYTIRESPSEGYAQSYDNCTGVTVPSNGSATCILLIVIFRQAMLRLLLLKFFLIIMVAKGYCI